MNNITFEQLPQAVSMLIEKVGLLTDKVEKVLGMTPQQHGECRTLPVSYTHLTLPTTSRV